MTEIRREIVFFDYINNQNNKTNRRWLVIFLINLCY